MRLIFLFPQSGSEKTTKKSLGGEQGLGENTTARWKSVATLPFSYGGTGGCGHPTFLGGGQGSLWKVNPLWLQLFQLLGGCVPHPTMLVALS